MSIGNTNRDYLWLYEHFTEYSIGKRIEAVVARAEEFLRQCGYSDFSYVHIQYAENAVLDYFADIARLKMFHGISRVNKIKILAYSVYWVLRRKIIQMKFAENGETEAHFDAKGYGYLNEKFVKMWILEDLTAYLPEKNNVRNSEMFDVFAELLEYFFIYRQYSPQDIELMITAFLAGSDSVCKNSSARLNTLLPTDSGNDGAQPVTGD
jgi:hypothetical protein